MAVAFVFAMPAMAGTIVIDAAPDGVPSSAGRQDAAPVPLAHAIETAQAMRAARPHGLTLVIQLAPGTYRLAEPLLLTAADSGAPAAPLIIRASEPGTARLVGAAVIDDMAAQEISSDGYSLLPEPAREHVRAFRLQREILDRLGEERQRGLPHPPRAAAIEVSQGGRLMHSARWPDAGYARSRGAHAAEHDSAGPTIVVPAARAQRWAQETDLWAGGYWAVEWWFETARITNVDSAGSMTIAPVGLATGARPGSRYFVYNAVSELDRPGEFAFDARAGVLLAWPFEDAPAAPALEITVTETLVHLRGARNIRFENLTFELARGDAVVVEHSSDIIFDGCTVAKAGGRGIVVRGGADNHIERTIVSDTGESAISLAGGNRQALKPAGHAVRDSVLTRFGRLGKTISAGVEIDGVGQIVEGNFIAEAPHKAILFAGNEHRIQRNEITRVVRETSDAGAIYAGRDWTARGTRIRENYIHGIQPMRGRGVDGSWNEVKGVYLDDFLSGTRVEDNLFVDVMQPVFVGGGRDNVIAGNVFVDSPTAAVHIDDRGLSWAAYHVYDEDGELRGRLARSPYRTALYRSRYPKLATILDDDPALPKNNEIAGNVVVGSALHDMTDNVARLQRLGETFDEAALGSDVAAMLRALGGRQDALPYAGVDGELPFRLPPFEQLDRRGRLSDLLRSSKEIR